MPRPALASDPCYEYPDTGCGPAEFMPPGELPASSDGCLCFVLALFLAYFCWCWVKYRENSRQRGWANS